MNEHVGKPFDMRQLVALLLQITGREVPNTVESVQATHEPQRSSGTSSGPYLDVAVALERLSGMTDLYLDIAGDYLKSLELVEGEFRQAAVPAQWSALVSQMHSLKGVSATLGAQALSEHAARLEKLFRNPPAEMVALEQLSDLLALVSATHAAVQSAVQTLASEVVEESVQVRLPSGQIERDIARAFLAELQDLLATNSLVVLDRFASRGHALDAMPKSDVDELQAALQSLNLERARQLCEANMQTLEGD
jgi:HPt (histidine-containing phosphotransfer) domain-containing protein